MDTPSGLLSVSVGRYKNLRHVWLPWSDGLALFGPNGAGKTNLLECLALLMGSDLTVELARPRLAAPEPGSLNFVARLSPSLLPWSPDLTLWWANHRLEAEQSGIAGLAKASYDGRWWEALGARGGSDLHAGLLSAGLPDSVVRLVHTAVAVPRVRFALQNIDTQARPVLRSFSRTLMTDEVPSAVNAMAEDLPDLFAPLLASKRRSQDPDGLVPLLELPPASSAPVTLQWLPRARTSLEATTELEIAFERASSPVRLLAETLGTLSDQPPQEGDWHWWLHELGQRWGAEELESVFASISLEATGGNDADFDLYSRKGDTKHPISDTRGTAVLEPFSAGERRWVDEALASVSREYNRFASGADAHWQAFFDIDDDQARASVKTALESAVRFVSSAGYWNADAFDQLLQALEPALLVAERRQLQEMDNELTKALSLESNPGLGLLDPSPLIRVFDEPEAHLHVSAQLAIADHLQSLRHRGQNVLIATHSAAFLDLPGWSQARVSPDLRGKQVEPLSGEASTARTSLAQQLGINRSELLAGIHGLVIVEGPHDQLVLTRLFNEELRTARLAIVRIYGTNHLASLAELDFIERYLDVPVAVILDYTRTIRIEAGEWESEEERKLVDLQRSRVDAPFHVVGLERPDIVCYLHEDAVREVCGPFPGWEVVISAFSGEFPRPRFKPWLRHSFGIDLRGKQIEKVLQQMTLTRQPPASELVRKVNGLIASWLPPKPN